MPPSREVQIVTMLRRRIPDTDPGALTNLAWFAARRGVMALALEAACTAAGHPAASPATARAVQRLSSGRLDGLTLWCGEVQQPGGDQSSPGHSVTGTPSSPELWQRGRHLLETGSVAEALQAFDLLLTQNPADTSARFHRGVALAKLRRYADALNEWDRVGRVDREGPLGAISRRHARSARQLATLFHSR